MNFFYSTVGAVDFHRSWVGIFQLLFEYFKKNLFYAFFFIFWAVSPECKFIMMKKCTKKAVANKK